MKYLFLPVTVLGALLLPGCVSFDPAEARQDQTSQFSHTLEMRAQDYLTRPLTLDDCLRIAMTNNYDIRLAELDKLIGSFDTQLAFSAFLPQVSASVNYLSYRKDPVQTSKNYAYGSGDLGWSVFMPSTWFLYDAAKHAQEAAALAADYTRQTIVLQTTAAFYDVRVQEDLCRACEQQVKAATQTADRVQGLAEEGYARPWERDQALQIKEAREAELASARRQLVVLKGNLLQLLGFSPLAPVELSAEEAKSGTIKEVTVTRSETCSLCSGSGHESGSGERSCANCNGCGLVQGSKSIKVRIPADVKSGAKLRVQGQGNAGRGEAQPGDLYVHITVREESSIPPSQTNSVDHTTSLKEIADAMNPLKNPTVLISPTAGVAKAVSNILKNK